MRVVSRTQLRIPAKHMKHDKKCSFCHKHIDEVLKLVASENANICNECVDLCADIIQEAIEEDTKAKPQ